LIKGTVAAKIANVKYEDEYKVLLEHPLGSIECIVNTSSFHTTLDDKFINSCGIYRTSRKIMDGNVYVHEDIIND
jgi:2-methylaconitate cis-trans-isomerase PrpF